MIDDFAEFCSCVTESVKYPTPETFDQAVKSKHANDWKLAMTEEIHSMSENGAWKLVPLPKWAKTIDSKRVLRLNKD